VLILYTKKSVPVVHGAFRFRSTFWYCVPTNEEWPNRQLSGFQRVRKTAQFKSIRGTL
jgi:hypothetical protein